MTSKLAREPLLEGESQSLDEIENVIAHLLEINFYSFFAEEKSFFSIWWRRECGVSMTWKLSSCRLSPEKILESTLFTIPGPSSSHTWNKVTITIIFIFFFVVFALSLRGLFRLWKMLQIIFRFFSPHPPLHFFSRRYPNSPIRTYTRLFARQYFHFYFSILNFQTRELSGITGIKERERDREKQIKEQKKSFVRCKMISVETLILMFFCFCSTRFIAVDFLIFTFLTSPRAEQQTICW